MVYQKHCPGCFANKNSLAVCPTCGYDESALRADLYLPHGLILGGQYRVGRMLGRPGGFGISYLAWDIHLQQRVAIKEYLPRALAGRKPGVPDVVVSNPAQQPEFDQGLQHFLHEARVIARLDHPNVVRVRNFFRAHGTAYLVMDYYEGVSLGDYLAGLTDGRVEPVVAVELLGSVLLGLQFVHEHGVLHRDIKPHNIYLASGGRAILLDFGSASAVREAQAGAAAPVVVLSEGYAPLEQYQRDGQQGAWTDVYSVAATLYRMVVGAPPPAALDRVGQDPLAKASLPGPASFQAVLRKGLALRADARYASSVAFRAALFEALALDDGSEAITREYLPTQHIDAGGETAGYDAAPASAAQADAPLATREDLRQAARLVSAALFAGAALIALVLWLRLG